MGTPCHIPSKEFEAVRDYQRMVADTKDAVGTAQKQLLMFLHRQDCPSYEGTYWTQRHLQWIKAVSLDPVDRETCDEYLMMVKELQNRLDRQLVRLEEFAAMKEFSDEVAKLKCFKGISTQTALALVTEVEDFQRFPTARSFMAYVGLVTSEHSSGGRAVYREGLQRRVTSMCAHCWWNRVGTSAIRLYRNRERSRNGNNIRRQRSFPMRTRRTPV
jgi:transposase